MNQEPKQELEDRLYAAKGEATIANAELEKLRNAVRNLRDVSGRHHTQIAYEQLINFLPESNHEPRTTKYTKRSIIRST